MTDKGVQGAEQEWGRSHSRGNTGTVPAWPPACFRACSHIVAEEPGFRLPKLVSHWFETTQRWQTPRYCQLSGLWGQSSYKTTVQRDTGADAGEAKPTGSRGHSHVNGLGKP